MVDKNGEKLEVGDWCEFDRGATIRPFGKITQINSVTSFVGDHKYETATLDSRIVTEVSNPNNPHYPTRTSKQIRRITEEEAMLLLLIYDSNPYHDG